MVGTVVNTSVRLGRIAGTTLQTCFGRTPSHTLGLKQAIPACVFLVLALLAPLRAETKGVDLELISETKTIQAGRPFVVGIGIHHHPRFHTYWKSPGIVGVPTKLEWKLPEGFEAGEIQWPTPERINMAGHPAHGYRRDVLLLVQITPPAELDGRSVTLTAETTWMACADACHPGSATLSLTLPVADEAIVDDDKASRFEEARMSLPAPLTGWKMTASINKETVLLRAVSTEETEAPKEIYFFSSNGLVSSDHAQLRKDLPGGGFELRMKLAEFGPKTAERLTGVLELTLEDGGIITGKVDVQVDHPGTDTE